MENAARAHLASYHDFWTVICAIRQYFSVNLTGSLQVPKVRRLFVCVLANFTFSSFAAEIGFISIDFVVKRELD